jgi:hypothetical protein
MVGIQRGGSGTHIKKLIFFSVTRPLPCSADSGLALAAAGGAGVASIFAGRTWVCVAGGADDTAT